MKNLVPIGIAASLASGCIISSSSSEEGHITASWTIKTVDPDEDLGCPPTFDAAWLYMQAADDAGNPLGSCATTSDVCFIDRFDCVDGVGVSESLPANNYIAWIAIEDVTGDSVYATSVAAYVDITSFDKDFHVDLIDNGGYFHFSWDLLGAVTGAPLSCASAGATGGIAATFTGAGAPITYAFDCGDGDDYTPALPAASYTVSIAAVDSANMALGPPVSVEMTLADHNDVQELGSIRLPISGL